MKDIRTALECGISDIVLLNEFYIFRVLMPSKLKWN